MTARRSLVGLLTVALLAVGGGAATAGVDRWLLPRGDDDVLGLLLIGSDMGPPRDGSVERGNADGFQLLFVSADRQHATFVSVPRDSYVEVPGTGRRRINTCLQAGPQRCVDTVASVFGVELDGYLLTGMRAFARGVGRFGGIEVDVPRSLRVGNTSIAAGEQLLDGGEALVYARDRKSRSDGDVGRSTAQAELLARAHAMVVEDGSPEAVLRAVHVLRRHTVTDLSGPQLVQLAFEALHLPPGNVQQVTLPGDVGWAGPASVVYLRESAWATVRDAADDGQLTP